ncbi:hypothetical protein [Sphingobacterium sp. HMA12]|uniref:hypothetical protein n=1 Tax=Sphingobacterium sp. HMA12 TaxID=2050894 RepID=UPI000CE9C6C5|nr:hypothetical protein [Sphingobacterium sp. HMA12]
MYKNQSAHKRCQGILFIVFALIGQLSPEDFPADIPEWPEEELQENDPNDEPEIKPDDLDSEEIDLGIQEEVPELDEQEIDESTDGAEDVPTEPRNSLTDLNEKTI